MTVEHKAFRPQVKAAGSDGSSRLVVATLGVEDLDGDVTLPGYFGRQTVAILPAHQWTHVPLGKGQLYEQGGEALVDVDWNLNVPEARSWFEAVRFDLENPPALQQWSYGYTVKAGGARMGDHQGHRVRFLQPLRDASPGVVVHEASPVLVGAGVGTRTLTVDSGRDEALREYARYVRDDLDRSQREEMQAIREGVA